MLQRPTCKLFFIVLNNTDFINSFYSNLEICPNQSCFLTISFFFWSFTISMFVGSTFVLPLKVHATFSSQKTYQKWVDQGLRAEKICQRSTQTNTLKQNCQICFLLLSVIIHFLICVYLTSQINA